MRGGARSLGLVRLPRERVGGVRERLDGELCLQEAAAQGARRPALGQRARLGGPALDEEGGLGEAELAGVELAAQALSAARRLGGEERRGGAGDGAGTGAEGGARVPQRVAPRGCAGGRGTGP
ncbi:hypothetical protein [Streptomyces sp. SPB78]|uniref:hypothetical protein n=1 Tax=Streptomyces sp. (strain SPB78) TaxID=591157 RepID=UPI0001B54938|nr:hypothetical protein [Streptomyces sp. SPB78]